MIIKFICSVILISLMIILGKGLYTFCEMYWTYFSGSEYQMYRWNDRNELPTIIKVFLWEFCDFKLVGISLTVATLIVSIYKMLYKNQRHL